MAVGTLRGVVLGRGCWTCRLLWLCVVAANCGCFVLVCCCCGGSADSDGSVQRRWEGEERIVGEGSGWVRGCLFGCGGAWGCW